MKKKIHLFTLAALAALAIACGATDNGTGNGDDDVGDDDDDGNTGGVTVADIQQGEIDVDAVVTLEGLIVTAVDVEGAGVDFWAQDAGGGAWSGIYFYDKDGVTPAEIAIGDEITVTGKYSEYPWDAEEGISEITPSAVEITDSGLTPTIDAIAAADIGTELAGDEAEKWEGCLIEIDGSLTVADLAVGYGEYVVANGDSGLLFVDDEIFDSLEGRFDDETIEYLAGIFHFAFEAFKIEPRSAQDVIGSDPIPAAAVPVAKITDQTASDHPAVETVLDVEGVTVVAIYTSAGNTKRNFWVQQGAGPWNGILVYDDAGLYPTIAVGDVINLRDVNYTEFKFSSWTDTVAELELTDNSVIEPVSTGATPAITEVSMADLLASPEQYEGVLIKLSDASVTVNSLNPDAPSDYKEYTVTDGTNSLRINDTLFDSRTGKTLSQSLTTVQGVLNYFVQYKLEPRSAADAQ